MADDDLAQALLNRFPTIGRIRFGYGVLTSISAITGIAVLVLGSVAWAIDDDRVLIVAGAILLTFLVYLAAALWFAHKHPWQTMLEGAEIAGGEGPSQA